MTASETVPATHEVAYNQGTEAPIDQLNRLSDQLEALMVTITGEGFDNFSGHSDEVQQSVLWMVHGMAHQIRIVAQQLDRAKGV